MTIEELNQLPISDRIKELKNRKTTLPDADVLLADWDEKLHAVNDTVIRPKRRIKKQEEIRNEKGVVTQKEEFDFVDVNRIAIPLEQDIVNIHTAFTVGIEPKLTLCASETDKKNNDKEQEVYEILTRIYKQCKMKYINKKAVRSWLSEQEVAEYWYTVQDDTWWKKVLNKIIGLSGGKQLPNRKFRVAIWSPFRGDKLYPYFDNYGELIAFSREYQMTVGDNKVTKFMTIDKNYVTVYVDEKIEEQFKHNFEKIPVIYMYRQRAFCDKIKTVRERLETLMSNYADCIDYNFFPKLAAKGEIVDMVNRNSKGSEIIQLEPGAEISYLTWAQSPETAKLEFDRLTENAYSMTNTPQISFEHLKGIGNGLSGVAFKFAFMGAHMAVSNHAEDVEEYLQRRVNFLVSAIGSVYPALKEVIDTIDIETELVPYIIGNRAADIADAVRAVDGNVASQKTGILLAGLVDKVEEELEEINSQKQKDWNKEEFGTMN